MVLGGDSAKILYLLRQTCDAVDVNILTGGVSKDHIRLHLSYQINIAARGLVRRLKCCSTKKLLEEFCELRGW